MCVRGEKWCKLAVMLIVNYQECGRFKVDIRIFEINHNILHLIMQLQDNIIIRKITLANRTVFESVVML